MVAEEALIWRDGGEFIASDNGHPVESFTYDDWYVEFLYLVTSMTNKWY